MLAFALAGMSLLGVLIGATLQYVFSRQNEARKLLIAQKALAYTDYFKAVDSLAHERNDKLLASAADAKTRICLFGAQNVIKSLISFDLAGSFSSSVDGQHALASLLEEMRRDLLGLGSFSDLGEIKSVLFGSQKHMN